MGLNVSSAKWRTFCLGINVLKRPFYNIRSYLKTRTPAIVKPGYRSLPLRRVIISAVFIEPKNPYISIDQWFAVTRLVEQLRNYDDVWLLRTDAEAMGQWRAYWHEGDVASLYFYPKGPLYI